MSKVELTVLIEAESNIVDADTLITAIVEQIEHMGYVEDVTLLESSER